MPFPPNFKERQAEIDCLLIELDGAPYQACLGANAILDVSQAAARAATGPGECRSMSSGGADAACRQVPMMDVLNGGEYDNSTLNF